MALLELRSVSAGYAGKDVLHEVSLAIQGGRILALAGPNGAGKTTLLRVVCRLLRPSAGSVSLDGQDLSSLHELELARSLARVPQSASLAWPFTVRQIVQLGRLPHLGWFKTYTREDHRLVDEALKATGLWELGDRPVTTLSGGERQRALIARSLAQSPRVLVLDEPVAHLDLAYQVSVLDLLRTLARQGLAVVLSLHDLNLASLYADSLALLAGGRLSALGRPREILRQATIEAAYGTAVTVIPHPEEGLPMVLPRPRGTGEKGRL